MSTYYYSCLDWYSMYAIRYKELVKKDEGINNNMAKKRDKKNMMKKPLQRNYGDKVAVI